MIESIPPGSICRGIESVVRDVAYEEIPCFSEHVIWYPEQRAEDGAGSDFWSGPLGFVTELARSRCLDAEAKRPKSGGA